MVGMDGAKRVLEQVIRERARCSACDKRPDRSRAEIDISDGVTIWVKCHGSVDKFHLTEEQVEDRDLAKAVDWMAALFPLDGCPDMKELLKYNREPWVLT